MTALRLALVRPPREPGESILRRIFHIVPLRMLPVRRADEVSDFMEKDVLDSLRAGVVGAAFDAGLYLNRIAVRKGAAFPPRRPFVGRFFERADVENDEAAAIPGILAEHLSVGRPAELADEKHADRVRFDMAFHDRGHSCNGRSDIGKESGVGLGRLRAFRPSLLFVVLVYVIDENGWRGSNALIGRFRGPLRPRGGLPRRVLHQLPEQLVAVGPHDECRRDEDQADGNREPDHVNA